MQQQTTRKSLAQAKLFQKTILNNKFVVWKPTKAQTRLLTCGYKEVLYGGAAGPGKTVGLLQAAAQYVEHPMYSAILLRKSYKQLKEPKALIDLSKRWWTPFRESGEVHWSELDKIWTFPSGATLKFGYLDSENDKYNYQGAEYTFIGTDELTQIDQQSYLYVMSRLRKTVDNPIPLRMWSTTNPGGQYHEWVKERFIPEDIERVPRQRKYEKTMTLEDGSTETTVFIPGKLSDNPYLNRIDYVKTLMHLDPVTRKQLLEGDWTARHAGGLFKREWFKPTDKLHPPSRKARYWDMAATERKYDPDDPDWTAGVLMAMKQGTYYLLDVKRFRKSPMQCEDMIKRVAQDDERKWGHVEIWMEEEPGASGKSMISHYGRNVLRGYTFRGNRSTGSKLERAAPASSAAELGNMYRLEGDWWRTFRDEAESFPQGIHDDQVDALSGAFSVLSKPTGIILY